MKPQSKSLIAFTALGFAAGSALAQMSPTQPQPAPQPAPAPSVQPSAPTASGAPGSGGGAKYTFETLDKDNDGAITKSEASLVPTLTRAFNTLDKNRDGKIDRKEFDGVSIAK